MGKVNVPSNLLDRVRRLERELAEVRKRVGLGNASISTGSLTIQGGGGLTIEGGGGLHVGDTDGAHIDLTTTNFIQIYDQSGVLVASLDPTHLKVVGADGSSVELAPIAPNSSTPDNASLLLTPNNPASSGVGISGIAEVSSDLIVGTNVVPRLLLKSPEIDDMGTSFIAIFGGGTTLPNSTIAIVADELQISGSPANCDVSIFGTLTVHGDLTTDGAAYKPFDTSRVSNTTLTDDPNLRISVEANAVYLAEMSLVEQAAAGADFSWELGVPNGATFDNYRYLIPGPAYDVRATATSTAFATGSGGNDAVTLWGTLITGGTAGTFALRWAQRVSSGTATILRAGSSMRLTRVT